MRTDKRQRSTCRICAGLCGLLAAALAGCGISSSGANIPTAEYQAENEFMQGAVNEARKGIYCGDGGPFGSVIVKDGQIIAKGHSCVLAEEDSTCHGEMEAIRNAERKLGSRDLSGCELYTTAEPCAMCLSAGMLAKIDHIYYGCTAEDTAELGFRNPNAADRSGNGQTTDDYLSELDRDACLELFEEYRQLE